VPIAVPTLGKRRCEPLDLRDAVGVERRLLRFAALVCCAHRVGRQTDALDAIGEHRAQEGAPLVDRPRRRTGRGEGIEQALDVAGRDLGRRPVAQREHDLAACGAVRLGERVAVVGQCRGLGTPDPLQPPQIIAGDLAERRTGRADPPA